MASPVWSPGSSPRRAAAAAVVAAGLVAVAGLAYVKWLPYYHRLLAVSLTHALGSSLFGPEGYFTAVNLGVAWSYAVEYFRSVWQAALLGLVLGGPWRLSYPQRGFNDCWGHVPGPWPWQGSSPFPA